MTIRQPVVAGSFYPAGPDMLIRMIDELLEKEMDSIEIDLAANSTILGGIVPHAGYQYSGYEAVHFFKLLAESRNHYDTVIIMHPNHYGRGPEIATDNMEGWETPLGQVRIDSEMIDWLGLKRSSATYQNEPAAEVMLPFLQKFLKKDFIYIVKKCGC